MTNGRRSLVITVSDPSRRNTKNSKQILKSIVTSSNFDKPCYSGVFCVPWYQLNSVLRLYFFIIFISFTINYDSHVVFTVIQILNFFFISLNLSRNPQESFIEFYLNSSRSFLEKASFPWWNILKFVISLQPSKKYTYKL